MTVVQIARALHWEPKKLYFRIGKILAELRDALKAQGVDRGEVLEALGTPRLEIDLASLRHEPRRVWVRPPGKGISADAQFIEHEPGPRGSPQLPQDPGA
ncbi:MAG TPA: hypothetical protein VGC53_21015 [Vicinamibacteria bacterium]